MIPEQMPTTVTVRHGSQPLRGTPALPGAKYATVRTVLAAALAGGESTVDGIALSDDTAVLLRALTQLGIAFTQPAPEQLRVVGCGGCWPATDGAAVSIDAGNAGAVLRLMLGVTATLPAVTFTTTYAASLGTRPNADLLDALRQLGVAVVATDAAGRLPITLHGANIHGGVARISCARSSQYLSALLLLAPLIESDVTIVVTEPYASASFVRLTLATLAAAGIVVEHDAALRQFHIAKGQRYQARDWRLPRDYPTAATWLAAGASAGDVLTLDGLASGAEDGAGILQAAQALGVDLRVTPAATAGQITLTVRGGAPLRGAALDGEPIIDSVPVLAALACFAEGTTIFHNVANLRLKESNRIDALCAELCRVGAEAIPGADTITIVGHPEGVAGGVVVDTHDDHRLAMALAVVALRARADVTITGAHHVAKSYPRFWQEFARIGADIMLHDAENDAM